MSLINLFKYLRRILLVKKIKGIKIKTLGFLICSLIGGVGVPGPALANEEVLFHKRTYTYKVVDQVKIKVDVYRSNDSIVQPGVVWLHGGALIFGTRKSVPKELLNFCRTEGYILISFDYRLAPEVKLPAIIDDIIDGFNWIDQDGPGLFHIDPHKLVVAGGSAGGYLTLMSGFRVTPRPSALISYWGYGDVDGRWYTQPSPYYRKVLPPISKDEAEQALSDHVLTNTNKHNRKARAWYYRYLRQNGLWTKEVTGFDPETQRSELDPYCPVRNVTPNYPPVLMIHGMKDADVPYEQSVAMAKELSRNKIPHMLITLPKGGHGLVGAEKQLVADSRNRALFFIKEQLQ